MTNKNKNTRNATKKRMKHHAAKLEKTTIENLTRFELGCVHDSTFREKEGVCRLLYQHDWYPQPRLKGKKAAELLLRHGSTKTAEVPYPADTAIFASLGDSFGGRSGKRVGTTPTFPQAEATKKNQQMEHQSPQTWLEWAKHTVRPYSKAPSHQKLNADAPTRKHSGNQQAANQKQTIPNQVQRALLTQQTCRGSV